jgi:hypothetical protein
MMLKSLKKELVGEKINIAIMIKKKINKNC